MPSQRNCDPHMLIDAMLGRLARWLRILGYDARYNPRWTDNELVRLARAEGRILLTRDVALSRRRGVRTLLIASDDVEAQLCQVVKQLDLRAELPFSRCPACNEQLEEVPRGWAWGYVPPYTFVTHREFRLCPDCNRFYWRGTHWERMRSVLARVCRC